MGKEEERRKEIPVADLKGGKNDVKHLEDREKNYTDFISEGSVCGVGDSDE